MLIINKPIKPSGLMIFYAGIRNIAIRIISLQVNARELELMVLGIFALLLVKVSSLMTMIRGNCRSGSNGISWGMVRKLGFIHHHMLEAVWN